MTVAGCYNFMHDYGSLKFTAKVVESTGEKDNCSAVDLLIEQIKFCDVVVLNKTDLMSETEKIQL